MKQKEQYTLTELYDNLEITLTELSKRSDMSHGTLTRIRDGIPARRSTVNKLLRIFSEIYGIELSVDNVSGIALESKGRHEKIQSLPSQKPKETPISTMPLVGMSEIERPQNRPVEPKKRAYVKKNKEKKSTLPDGCILATDFAKIHGLPRETFRDHMIIGLGPGVPWGMGNEMTVEKDHADYSERQNPSRPKEKEKYLTQEQQAGTIQFWKRHDVLYSQCDRADCPCHETK